MRLSPLLALFIFLQSCGQESEFSGIPAARASLRVLDINVWSGLDYIGNLKMGEYETAAVREKRYQALLVQIRELDPDIIGVHEANKLPDYAERLAGDLDYDVFYHVGVGGVRLGKVGLPWNLREGDAILTKRDLQGEFAGREQLSGGHVGSFFTFHFSDATQVIAVKVLNRGQPFFVFATHWHASILKEELDFDREGLDPVEFDDLMQEIQQGIDWRLAESEKTIAMVRDVAGKAPFILIGDFNATAETEEIQKLIRAGMVDAYGTANPDSSGFTWAPETNLNVRKHYLAVHQQRAADLQTRAKQIHQATSKRIDFIFAGPTALFNSGTLSLKSSRVVMNKVIDGVHTSDHYGVFAEIEFN